ncbi:hypothetical protein DFS34DRAFT_651911 [Phlyctochytrium arcticum]|nr:hypothetical protein DFS34DRAFT_651911 [Phlyctochytrium arcticum]
MIPRILPVLKPAISEALAASSSSFDGLLVIYSKFSSLSQGASNLGGFAQAIQTYTQADASAATSVSLIPCANAPGARIVLSPTGSLLGDVDDVRRFAEAARKGLARSKAAGIKRPLVILSESPNTLAANSAAKARLERDYERYLEVTLLGLLAEAYVPLQAREHLSASGKPEEPFTEIGIVIEGSDDIASRAVSLSTAIEEGRRIAKDMGGADPERMTPLRAAEYVENSFKGTDVKVTVTKDTDVLLKEYPLLHAVARASLVVPRHRPSVVRLEYYSPDQSQVKENIFLVGKGVTYDTGGLDIKAGGIMRGMSRDKCGATACAGFLKTVAALKPKHINVVAELGFVRNSCGADGYVSDEIIVSRAGVRVLVGNTDAEGRMVMCDLIASQKERALTEKHAKVPTRILTVATLTGHAVRAVGNYTAVLDNGPAREAGISQRLYKAGHTFGDPCELSSLRREDYEFVQPGSANEDVVQANDKASTMTCRGHQFPAAFMAIASGLTNHGLDSEHPISYTHVDIAGSAEEGGKGLSLMAVTGAPVAALTGAFVL